MGEPAPARSPHHPVSIISRVVGRGSVNWEELVVLLDEAGYSGWVGVDPVELTDRVVGAREAVQYLRKVMGA